MRTQVLELYTAYFNRAADTAGVNYWLNEMDNNDWSINNVAQSFSQQTEYTNLYAGLSNAQIVSKVYTNVLNRTADEAGATYWESELANGNISVNQLVLAVVNAAKEDVNNLGDDDVLSNKSVASQYAYDNNNSNTNISLADITSNASTVDGIKSEINISSAHNSNYLLRAVKFDDNGDGHINGASYCDYDTNANETLLAKDNDNDGILDYTLKDFYDKNNKLIKIENDYDLSDEKLNWTSDYFYENNILNETISYASDTKYIDNHYYDNDDNLTKTTSSRYNLSDILISKTIHEYTYDSNGNRVSAIEDGDISLTYTYDDNDNLLTLSTGSRTSFYTYNSDNLVTTEKIIDSWRQDEDNYLFSWYYTYQYDSEGNLIKNTCYDSSSSIDTIIYNIYDDLGNMTFSKRLDSNGNLTSQTEFIYDTKSYTTYLEDTDFMSFITDTYYDNNLYLDITDDTKGIATSDIKYTFTFSDDVTGFGIEDITVDGGIKSIFTKTNSSVYTLVVTPDSNSQNDIIVDVASNVAVDNLGNSNSTASSIQDVNTLQVNSEYALVNTIVVGASVTGEIEFPSEEDYFKVYLNSGNIYLITLDGDGLETPLLKFYNTDGYLEKLDHESSNETVAILGHRTLESGYYFISASDLGSDTGSYILSVEIA
jgi:hypothetical protein